MTARWFRSSLLGAVFVSVMSASIAHAYCLAGHFPWSSTSTKTMALSTTFPSGMRAAVQSGVQKWNLSGSALFYAAPVYTAAWPFYAFTGEYVSFSAYALPNFPGYSTGVGTPPSHSTGSVLFNSDFGWVNGSQNLALMIADTATVTVHEVGHQNGMAHYFDCPGPYTPGELASVMDVISTGTRRNLSSDDIDYQTTEY